MAKQNGVRSQAPARLADFPMAAPKPPHGPFSWTGEEVDQFVLNEPAIAGVHSGHVHWTIQAYQEKAPNGGLLEVVQGVIEAPDAYAAVHRARVIFPLAKHYRVAGFNEACTLTDGLRDKIASE